MKPFLLVCGGVYRLFDYLGNFVAKLIYGVKIIFINFPQYVVIILVK